MIELLVYMAILGFIIVVAGRAFSDATGMRLRSQNMVNSAEEAGRISALLKEDISQMGTKSWGFSSASTSSASGITFDTVASVHMNFNNVANVPANLSATNTDLSSYRLGRSYASSYDTLTFRKAYYNASGICSAVLEVKWYVRMSDSTLVRECSNITPSSNNRCTGTGFTATDCPATIEMAKNVAQFRFLPSRAGYDGSSSPSAADTLYNSNAAGTTLGFIINGNAATTTSGGTLAGFQQNSSSSGTLHTNFYLADGSGCKSFTSLIPGEEYVISFDIPYLPMTTNDPCRNGSTSCDVDAAARYKRMSMFQAGRDHLSIGLRNGMTDGSYGGVPDFLFYPPQDPAANASRYFEFSVPSAIPSACIGITSAFYSMAADGYLKISNFKVYRKTDHVYHFDRSGGSSYNPSAGSAKAQVKAFELALGINKKGEINRSVTVIPVPNNGVLGGK
ncbi:MAG: hypothetical protein FWC26_01280 [Fibromonadales bacterium]|nr:hypothetical protein [Fibromonadales bacterium]